jgi:integrase
VGTPLRENKVLPRFQAICERLGLPNYTLHQMRHTYATQLFAIGTHPARSRN